VTIQDVNGDDAVAKKARAKPQVQQVVDIETLIRSDRQVLCYIHFNFNKLPSHISVFGKR